MVPTLNNAHTPLAHCIFRYVHLYVYNVSGNEHAFVYDLNVTYQRCANATPRRQLGGLSNVSCVTVDARARRSTVATHDTAS